MIVAFFVFSLSLTVTASRVRHFLDLIDPLTLLVTQSKLQSSLDLLQQHAAHSPSVRHCTDRELWAAKKVRDSVTHPDTAAVIPRIGRMAAFVPVNIALTYGMLSAKSPRTQVLWQWLNQSYNVCLNYNNRSISTTHSGAEEQAAVDYQSLATAYTAAVAVSCTLAVSLSKVAERVALSTAPVLLKTSLSLFVPYTAVSLAGASNVVLMRFSETQTGIAVKNAEHETIGMSRSAGVIALTQTAVTRMASPILILLAPPLLMHIADRTAFLSARPQLRTPIYLSLITLCLFAALPLSLALYPQLAAVRVSELEEEFQSISSSSGRKYDTLFFNKGL